MKNQEIPYKIYLTEDEMPKAWYNLRADMINKPAPLLNPGTLEPMKPEELEGVFCDELVKQELDDQTPYFPYPRRNSGILQNVSPLAAHARLSFGSQARHSGAHLL